MKIITKKFIECPSCGALIPIERRKLSVESRKKIGEGVKKAWDKKRHERVARQDN